MCQMVPTCWIEGNWINSDIHGRFQCYLCPNTVVDMYFKELPYSELIYIVEMRHCVHIWNIMTGFCEHLFKWLDYFSANSGCTQHEGFD